MVRSVFFLLGKQCLGENAIEARQLSSGFVFREWNLSRTAEFRLPLKLWLVKPFVAECQPSPVAPLHINNYQ